MREIIRYANNHVSLSDKEVLEKQIEKILKVSEIARRDGLLGLKAFTQISECKEEVFLEEGISLIIEGTDPEDIEEIMYNKIYANGDLDVKALCQIIITKGLLSVQKGLRPSLIEKILKSCVCDAIVNEMEPNITNIVLDKMKKIRNTYTRPLTTEDVMQMLENASNKQ